ncbi:MAG: galactokinase [Phycisphaeraceae bacterium]
MTDIQVPTIAAQHQRAAARFREIFGRSPRFAAAAPGRVNLIGEHTDYNDGFVLPMAIQRQTVIVADRAGDPSPNEARVVSTNLPEEARFPVARDTPTGAPSWSNYMRGVVAACAQRGLDPGGFDAVIDSTVPTGGGLSSSAALEVATATLIEAMTGRALDGKEKALLCQWAEHEYAGMPCGIMDQFISAMAQTDHALLIDCRTHETEPVPLDDPDIAVLIVNSNVAHELVGGEYAERRRQCETAAKALNVAALRDATMVKLDAAKAKLDETTRRRARHVITENERTLDAAARLKQRHWPAAGELMHQSHVSLRDDFEVSCPELDLLVALAMEHHDAGVFGSRMTGGGFGGCTVTLLRADAVERVTADITTRYEKETGITPSAFATRAAAGARIINTPGPT